MKNLFQVTSMMTLVFVIMLTVWVNDSNAQTLNQNSRLSIFTEIGLLNGDMLHNPVELTQCFECFSTVENIPRLGIRWNLGMEVRLGKRSYIGAGYMANKIEYTERTPDIWDIDRSYSYQDFEFKFRGAILQCRYALLHRNNWQLSPVIGMQYDKFNDDDNNWGFQLLRTHNYSAYTKMEVAITLSTWNQITLSPIFKIAVKRYNHFDLPEKFLPFGYGLMMGWRVKMT